MKSKLKIKGWREYLISGVVALLVFVLVYLFVPPLFRTTYTFAVDNLKQPAPVEEKVAVVLPPPVTHVKTPEAVKGVYMTSCVASMPGLRAKMVKIIKETELNSLVIDIKDYTGRISFKTSDPEFAEVLSTTCPVKDLEDFVRELHKDNIYVIGRITVFQDLYMAKKNPELAVKTFGDKTKVWKDRKGMTYIDAGAQAHWKHIANLAKLSYDIGFDELNFDYIRFPSDGNMKDIYFPFSEETVMADSELGKAKVVRSFFEYLSGQLKPLGIPMSADLFGMTASNTDDLGIGQILEYAAPYFDYVAPMVYPSHYPVGFNGYKDVNAHPYDIVKFSMDKAVARLTAASTTPLKLRPWLQDNDYPVHYTPEMVRAQIKATYDAGLTSWMLWDAANTYTQAALLPE